MKNLFTGITLFIGASILFSSCGHQDLALTKRHYRNGYYVEHSSKPATQKVKEQEPVFADQSAFSSEKTTEPKVENDLFASADNTKKIEQNDVVPNNSSIIKPIQHKSINKSLISTPSTDSKINTPSNFQENKRSVKKLLRHSDGGGHGLIWTIIVILLIVWLIALLTGGWGLGGLLWLFLVVALILLILRLLGLF